MIKRLTASRLWLVMTLVAVTAGSVSGGTPGDGGEGMVKETYVYAVKGSDTLRLDVYHDPTVAYKGKRPVIIFSFGGGWEAGARADGAGSHTPFLNSMTRYGYVTVGIDYRLGYLRARKSGQVDDVSICEKLVCRKMDRNVYDCAARAIDMAVEDLYDATRYVVENAGRWNADPAKVIISGISAGGINSLTAEYRLANGMEQAVERVPEGFSYAGVISGCGAIWHNADEELKWKRAPCPTMFIHGDHDTVVAYDRWEWSDGNFAIDGSKRIAGFFGEYNVPYMLVTGTGGYHPYGGGAFATNHDLINLFITDFVLKASDCSTEIVETPLRKE